MGDVYSEGNIERLNEVAQQGPERPPMKRKARGRMSAERKAQLSRSQKDAWARKRALQADDPNAIDAGGGSDPEVRTQNLPIWDRVAETMKARGSTPSDFLSHEAMEVRMPARTAKYVRPCWMSNIMAERMPVGLSFVYSPFQPMTPEQMKEMGVTVRTKDRTAAGVPKVGDAFLCWAPESVARQTDDHFRELSRIAVMQKAHGMSDDDIYSVPGDPQTHGFGKGVVVSGDPNVIAEARKREEWAGATRPMEEASNG